MSIRTAIARLLAPEVFRERDEFEFAHERQSVLAKEGARLCDKYANIAAQRARALRSIASLRTPNCAHGVKRACDIAEAALADEGSAG